MQNEWIAEEFWKQQPRRIKNKWVGEKLLDLYWNKNGLLCSKEGFFYEDDNLYNWFGFGMIVDKMESWVANTEDNGDYCVRVVDLKTAKMHSGYSKHPWEAAAIAMGKMKGLIG